MKNDDKHKKIKIVLRVIGFICLPVGIILLLCGTIPFFSGDVSTFNLNFIAMPLIFVGAVCLMWGFMREVNKYVTDENLPVVTDAANKILSDTREETVKTAAQIKEKLPVCGRCGEVNEKGANFCDRCGAPLKKKCADCGEMNDSDAKFCRNCGKQL